METKQKMQFNRGHVSAKYLIAFLFIACGGILLARNMEWITPHVYDMLVSWQALVAVLGLYAILCRHFISSLVFLGITMLYDVQNKVYHFQWP